MVKPVDQLAGSATRLVLVTRRHQDADNDDHDEAEGNTGDAEPKARERHAPVVCLTALDPLESDGPEDDGQDGSKAGERDDKSTDEADDAKNQSRDAEPVPISAGCLHSHTRGHRC